MKSTITTALFLVFFLVGANAASDHGRRKVMKICSTEDDRMSSSELRVGRMLYMKNGKRRACTVSLISRTCAVTAGHCLSRREEEKSTTEAAADEIFPTGEVSVDFNIPMSNSKGSLKLSKANSRFSIRKSKFYYKKKVSDWAVLQLKKNSLTNKTPGQAFGYFSTNFNGPSVGDYIAVIGYGINSSKSQSKYLNFTQRVSTGSIIKILSSDGKQESIYHDAASTGGSSGSPIINENDEIIGIHNAGSCSATGTRINQGILFSQSPRLKKAVMDCLAREEKLFLK